MNTHLRVSRLVGVYGELDRAERRMIDEHLRACDACRQAWCDEQRVRAYLKGLPCVEPPAGLEARLLAVPASAGAGGPAGREAWTGRPWWSPLVATVVVLGAVSTAAWGVDVLAPPPVGAPATVTGSAAAAGSTSVARAGRPPVVGRATAAAGDAGFGATTARAIGTDGFTRPASPAGAPADQAAAAAPTPGLAGGSPSAHDPAPARRGPSARGDRAAEGAPRAVVTASPRAPGPTTAAAFCADVSIRVFADVAGDGGDPACPTCDGRWTEADDARAAVLGLRLPADFHLAVYDADGRVRAESPLLQPAGARIDWSFGAVCGAGPLTVQVVGLPSAWTPCGTAPGDALTVREPAAAALVLGLLPACPVALPSPTPTPAPSATPPVPPAPTGTPTGAPTSGAPVEPPSSTPAATETGPTGPRPPRATVLPVGGTPAPAEPSPEPPAAASPTAASPAPTLSPDPPAPPAPIRLRPTPTPTPARDRPRPAPLPGPTKVGPWPSPPTSTPPGSVAPPAGQPG